MYDYDEIDTSKLIYALYARRSTEDETRKVNYITDQIDECVLLADRFTEYMKLLNKLEIISSISIRL